MNNEKQHNEMVKKILDLVNERILLVEELQESGLKVLNAHKELIEGRMLQFGADIDTYEQVVDLQFFCGERAGIIRCFRTSTSYRPHVIWTRKDLEVYSKTAWHGSDEDVECMLEWVEHG